MARGGVIAAVYMGVFGGLVGDVLFGVFLPLGLLVAVALAVTFRALPDNKSK